MATTHQLVVGHRLQVGQGASCGHRRVLRRAGWSSCARATQKVEADRHTFVSHDERRVRFVSVRRLLRGQAR